MLCCANMYMYIYVCTSTEFDEAEFENQNTAVPRHVNTYIPQQCGGGSLCLEVIGKMRQR